MTVEDGKTVAKPETDPAKNGYDFGGWQNGEAEYDFSAAVKSDLALTAKWTAHAYTITYELNGGTNSSENPATYTIESEDITLKDPAGPADKPNFGGWFKDAEFKTQVTKIAKGSTGDLALYAYFSEKAIVKHSVKVMCEGAEVYSGEVIDGAALSEDALNAAKAKIPEGYELEGCYGDAACTEKFDFTKAITADTVIYAKITARTFTVTFEGLEAKQTVEYGKTAAEPADKPTKDGYTFDGWDFDFSTPIKADTTVKAKWKDLALVSWSGEVSTYDWEKGVSISASDLAALVEGMALKITYSDDPESSVYKYHQFGLNIAGSETKLEGVDVALNDYKCVELPTGGTEFYFPLSSKDVSDLKANGLYIGGYGVVIKKIEYKTYKRMTVDSAATYKCVGEETSVSVTTYTDASIAQPFALTDIIKVVDGLEYKSGGVIFDFAVPAGKTFADYSVSGVFYFPRANDDDGKCYYKDVELHAAVTLTENGWTSALAKVGTDWSSNEKWKAFMPVADDDTGLKALTGNIQFAIGMNSAAGTYYLAEVFVYEK